MFEIHPADATKTAELAAKEGLDATSAMVVWNDGEEAGYVLYQIEKDTVVLLRVRCENEDLQEWLVRAALNAGVNRLATDAVCRESELVPLLERLGFAESEDGYTLFIPDFFNRPCAGGCANCH